MEHSIEVSHLSKTYKNTKAVDDLSFHVKKGSLFAFLGPNGAGKSTTINILTTTLLQDQGTVNIAGYILGRQDRMIRHEIGVIYQESVLDTLLTIEENLRTRVAFYGGTKKQQKDRVEEVIRMTHLEHLRHKPYGKCSGGERRKCDIARALLHMPTILFMDEPTTGLDPQTRKEIWTMLLQIQKEKNMTLFLTTHYMEEASSADYVVVLQKGKIKDQGTPNELKDKYSQDTLKLTTTAVEVEAYLLLHKVCFTKIVDTYEIPLQHTLEALPIIDALKGHLQSFEVYKGTLDDAFITMLKGEENDRIF